MKTIDALGESKYLKKNYQNGINKLTNKNHEIFFEVFFLGKKTGPSLNDSINDINSNCYISIN